MPDDGEKEFRAGYGLTPDAQDCPYGLAPDQYAGGSSEDAPVDGANGWGVACSPV